MPQMKYTHACFSSRVNLKPYSTKDHLNLRFIICNHFSLEVHFTFSSYLYFLALSLDNEHESMLTGKGIIPVNAWGCT